MSKEEFAVLVSEMMKAQEAAEVEYLNLHSKPDAFKRLYKIRRKKEERVIEEIYKILYPSVKG